MRKSLIVVAAALLVAVASSSCTKTCHCTNYLDGGQMGSVDVKVFNTKDCILYETSTFDINGSFSQVTSCNIIP